MSDPEILLLVRFSSALPFDEVARIARERADDFRALSGLRQKYYLQDPQTGEVGGLYVWESRAALDAYRASELRSSIASAYRVEGPPRVEALPVFMPLRPDTLWAEDGGSAPLAELSGSSWTGSSELWLDPLGDVARRSEATLAVEERAIRYSWSHEGTEHAGSVTLTPTGADFTDTFHQKDPMHCGPVPGARGLFQVEACYGPEADWGWRIGLALRAPTEELVLQMTNIAPWGEEVRAVRMVFQREE